MCRLAYLLCCACITAVIAAAISAAVILTQYCMFDCIVHDFLDYILYFEC